MPYGESWEICDRPEAQSRIVSPEDLAGRTLGDLWREQRGDIFGVDCVAIDGPFPLLVKILDARDRLSIQVHPPRSVAEREGSEPKTEMWFIAEADPGAVLYVGLKQGVTRENFRRGIATGETEERVHRIAASRGDFILIPSGRLHAIGAGLLIYEIQENSDTTYRVFDWNRMGLDGEPRQLHVEESLGSIDFSDIEPGLGTRRGEVLVACPEFVVEEWQIGEGESRAAVSGGGFAIVTVVDGGIRCGNGEFTAGDFFLVPANAAGAAGELASRDGGARVLRTTLPLAKAAGGRERPS